VAIGTLERSVTAHLNDRCRHRQVPIERDRLAEIGRIRRDRVLAPDAVAAIAAMSFFVTISSSFAVEAEKDA
jgi:hypothetical protein